MASVQREAALALPAPKVWAALREVGQPHRLFAGVLTASRLEGDVRTVTFANGMIAKEKIIDVDDARMRVAYSVIEGPFTYHGASMQVVANGPAACRVVWITDFLPGDLESLVAPLMEAGCWAMKRNLEVALAPGG